MSKIEFKNRDLTMATDRQKSITSIQIQEVSIDIIIDINGAVLGFYFIYFLPSILHIKCSYFPKGKKVMELKQHLFAFDDESTKKETDLTQFDNN